MIKRHENFSPSLPPTSDLIAHDRDPAPITMLLAKPFENSLSRVALFLRLRFIRFEDLMDYRNERPKRLFRAIYFPAIAGRLNMLKRLSNRPPVEIVLLGSLANTDLARQNGQANFCPSLHVVKHSFPHDSKPCSNYAANAANSSIAHQSQDGGLRALYFLTVLLSRSALHFPAVVYRPGVRAKIQAARLEDRSLVNPGGGWHDARVARRKQLH